jgi:hypothetical protein
MRKLSIVPLLGVLLAAQPALADDGARLVGTWKLVAFETEFQDGSPRRPVFGQNPSGYAILTAQGRLIAVLEAEGRKPAKTDEERAALLRSTVAYSGTYRVEGDKWTTQVDVAWNPAWRGTEQVRYFRIDGERLEITSAWQPDATLPGTPVTRGVLTWVRAK